MNKIGFIYQEGENDKDRFKIFDNYVEESKDKITKAADNLLHLYKSDDIDDDTRNTLKEFDKIDNAVEDIAKQNRLKKN